MPLAERLRQPAAQAEDRVDVRVVVGEQLDASELRLPVPATWPRGVEAEAEAEVEAEMEAEAEAEARG